MSKSEIKVMLNILPNYIEHLRKTPGSLIAKIFGIFTIEKEGFGEVHVMLMENTLQFHDSEKLECIFDLKGSTFDRSVKGDLKKSTIRKDLDFIAIKRKRPNLFKMQ
jgi:1-phosphatidylinositol-4-phosphate 5-kinase